MGSSIQRQTPEDDKVTQRPPGPERSDTAHSRYVEMLLNQDEIPKLHTILASFFVWLLLAGFLVFPGTFTSIEESIEDRDDDAFGNAAAHAILNDARNIPLIVIASVACGIAVLGMLWLSIKHRKNYVWLLNRLFLPGATNGLAGLISTLIGVYTQQNSRWNITAMVTAIVEIGCIVICGLLFLVIKTILLRNVKRRHGAHYGDLQGESSPNEGFVEKIERKAKEPALAPGSVV